MEDGRVPQDDSRRAREGATRVYDRPAKADLSPARLLPWALVALAVLILVVVLMK